MTDAHDMRVKREKERSFIRVREAALEVAAWEHEDKEDVASACRKVQGLKAEMAAARKRIPELKTEIAVAEKECQAVLEKYIPEDLRKVQK